MGTKVSHPIHGRGTVVSHSLGGGTIGTVVKFSDGKKLRVDHKKLRMEEVESVSEGFTDDMPADSMVGAMDKIRGDAKSQRYHHLQKLLKQSKNPKTIAQTKALLSKEFPQGVAEEIELDELRNVTQDNLGIRMGSGSPGYNKTPEGKARELKRRQEHLKGQMKFTKSQGGISGPKGKLPEEVEDVAEGYKEPTDAAGHAKMAAKIKKMLDDTLADRGDRHGNPDPQRLTRAYEYHMKKAKEKSQAVAEGSDMLSFGEFIAK